MSRSLVNEYIYAICILDNVFIKQNNVQKGKKIGWKSQIWAKRINKSKLGGFIKIREGVKKKLKRFQVILNFSLKIICFRPFWIYWYAYRKIIKETPIFLSVSSKKTVFSPLDGGGQRVMDMSVTNSFFLRLPWENTEPSLSLVWTRNTYWR